MLVGSILFEGQMLQFNKGHDNWSLDFISATLKIEVVVNE